MHLFVVLGKGTMLKTLVRFGFVVACSVCLCALECVATPAACIKATRVCVSICVYVLPCLPGKRGQSLGGSAAPRHIGEQEVSGRRGEVGGLTSA